MGWGRRLKTDKLFFDSAECFDILNKNSQNFVGRVGGGKKEKTLSAVLPIAVEKANEGRCSLQMRHGTKPSSKDLINSVIKGKNMPQK